QEVSGPSGPRHSSAAATAQEFSSASSSAGYWPRGLSNQSITARESSELVDGAGRCVAGDCGAAAAGGVWAGSRRSTLGTAGAAGAAVCAGGAGAGRTGGVIAGAGGATVGAGDETAGVDGGGVTGRTVGVGRLSAGGAAGGATATGGRAGTGARS